MAGRHGLFAVVLFALVVHLVAITHTILPAQDGLKFIRIARLFHSQPWADVIRGSDTHPLYPALIAAAEPAVATLAGRDDEPDTWRLTAQIVAAIASIGLVFPIYELTRSLFDHRIALMAAALSVLLPRAAELGHDTLSDSLGLFCTFLALWLGARAIRRGDWSSAVFSGLAGGLGYLTRPEAILVPCAIALTWAYGLLRDARARSFVRGPIIAALLLSNLAVIGCYAAVKGEISEKLAFRYNALLKPRKPPISRNTTRRARGLDNPRWDFSPKEETDRIPIRNWQHSALRILGKWWEELCWLFAVMTVWGIVRCRRIRELCLDRDVEGERDTDIEGRLLLIYSAVYGVALMRHSALLGYLSGRHIMALVAASIPWAAAGSFVCARGIAVKSGWNKTWTRNIGVAASLVVVAASLVVQMQPNHLNHLSRTGHLLAGRWLASHTEATDVVLDTRGWATFIANHPAYDYWHVRQALTDSHLSYVVVGMDELGASSSRAKTLRALLAYAAVPVKDFPAFPGDQTTGVRLYRFQRPDTWEGMVP